MESQVWSILSNFHFHIGLELVVIGRESKSYLSIISNMSGEGFQKDLIGECSLPIVATDLIPVPTGREANK